jgi:hypothetical protein
MWSALHLTEPKEVFTRLKLRALLSQPQTKNRKEDQQKVSIMYPITDPTGINEKTKILLFSLELSFSIQTKFINSSQQVEMSRVKRPLQFQPDWLNDKQIQN